MSWLTRPGWRGRGLILLLGVIAAFGFAPFHIWPLTVLALAALFIRLIAQAESEARPGRAGFASALFFGLGWFSMSCFWTASAFIERGPEFIPLIPPMVGGFAVLLSLFWAAAGAVIARFGRHDKPFAAMGLFIAAFMLAELARGYLLSGFPWNMAGYAFTPGGAASQAAAFVTIYGLTMIVYVVAGLIGVSVIKKSWRPALLSGLILAGLFAGGAARLQGAVVTDHPGLNLRLVSVPFRQSEKMNPETSIAIVNRFIEASLAPGAQDVTHLVWPEGAVNGLAIENENLLYAMGSLLTQTDDTPPVWLINSLREERQPDPDRPDGYQSRYYNSAVAITFDDSGAPAVAAINDKRKLVPFGEFIPGGTLVEDLGMALISTNLASITPAPEKRLADFPGLPRLSPQLCYEVVFPGLTPRDAAAPPALILNQSNDAWFGRSLGPHQHFAIARYRAIEEGLPMIRSASGGYSAVIDPYGRLTSGRLGPNGMSALGKDHDKLAENNLFHLDTTLPKPLKKFRNTNVVIFFITLLNLGLFLLCAAVGRVRMRSDGIHERVGS